MIEGYISLNQLRKILGKKRERLAKEINDDILISNDLDGVENKVDILRELHGIWIEALKFKKQTGDKHGK